MNFHSLFEQWQQNPHAFLNSADFIPAALAAGFALLVLVITIFAGDKRSDAWRFMGLTTATLAAISSLMFGLAVLPQESQARTNLRITLAEEVASQGWVLPKDANDPDLWHRLYQSGEAEVRTPKGTIYLTVSAEGEVAVLDEQPEPAEDTPKR